MTINRSPTRLYKDPRRAKCMGVCAGVSDYTGISLKAVRVLFVIGCIFSGIWPLVIGYFILGFVLEPKPVDLYEDDKEEEFWQQTRKAPDYSAAEMRKRFRNIERRTSDMEAYMTSKRFKLEQELKSLED